VCTKFHENVVQSFLPNLKLEVHKWLTYSSTASPGCSCTNVCREPLHTTYFLHMAIRAQNIQPPVTNLHLLSSKLCVQLDCCLASQTCYLTVWFWKCKESYMYLLYVQFVLDWLDVHWGVRSILLKIECIQGCYAVSLSEYCCMFWRAVVSLKHREILIHQHNVTSL